MRTIGVFDVSLKDFLAILLQKAFHKAMHEVITKKCLTITIRCTFFLVSYVEERPWWPIQSPNKGRKKKAKG